MDLDWMAWLPGTAIFFAALAILLVLLVVISIRWPSTPRRGFLRIDAARGDRIYVGFLGIGFIMIMYIAFTDLPLPYGLALGVFGWMAPVLRWG